MKQLGLVAASLVFAFAAVPAPAQDKYPSKTVKIVVPTSGSFGRGGAVECIFIALPAVQAVSRA